MSAIFGLRERIDQAAKQSGMTKKEIAKRAGIHKDLLASTHSGMNASTLAKFCAVTGADANWLLGLSSDRYTEEAVKKLRTFWSGHTYRGTGDGIADECERVLRGGR